MYKTWSKLEVGKNEKQKPRVATYQRDKLIETYMLVYTRTSNGSHIFSKLFHSHRVREIDQLQFLPVLKI